MERLQTPSWILDHIGQAADDIEAAVKFSMEVMGFSLELRETLTEEKVEVVFVKDSGGSLIELIAPLPGNVTLAKFLQSRGPGLHHVCYRVPNVASELGRLKALGVKLIDERPRRGSRGLDVAFLHPRSAHGVLLELCSS